MITCGIYLLNFNNYLSVYIGQSQDIESRYNRHIRDLKNNRHYNSKLQNAYRLYNIPFLEILEVCSAEDLTDKEMSWIDEFDSCKNGLNIRDRDDSALRGPNANSAKYSKQQIVDIFFLLIENKHSRATISEKTQVPIGNINSIARGASHLWLKESYPEEYKVLESLKYSTIGKSNSKGAHNKLWPALIDPLGNVYCSINNLREFCSTKNLPYDQFHRLCSGKAKSCHGWKIQK